MAPFPVQEMSSFVHDSINGESPGVSKFATLAAKNPDVSSATFRAVNKSGRREDNSVIPFINLVKFRAMEEHQNSICVIGGLGVTCYLRDLKFAGSNPTEVDGFFQNLKILSTNPPGGTLSWASLV